ncbi:MAG: hypothetical protein R2711_02940 [Acidimicrobiales bacterium]
MQQGDLISSPIDVAGAHVVIIGGDTGADCLGTAHRQGAASIAQLEIMPRPPEARPDATPWPTWPLVYRTSSAHEEGGDRIFSVNTERFLDDGAGRVKALLVHEVEMVEGRFEKVEGTDREIPADYVFLAMGFTGPESTWITEQFGVELDARSNVARDKGTGRAQRARRVRRRRHGAGPEPDRGHRRGPPRAAAVDEHLRARRSCR